MTGTIQKNMVLLWENPSPGSDFPAQTVNLDLSGYSSILLINQHSTSNANRHSHLIDIDGEYYGCAAQNYAGSWAGRTCKATSTGVIFDSGFAGTTHNGAAIPIKIYGIRA